MKPLFSLRRTLVLLTLLAAGHLPALAQTGVGIGTRAADPSAALDVVSSSQGLLLPRMSSAERRAIDSPAAALLVYQTDAPAGFYYNAGLPTAPARTLLSPTALGDNLGDHVATQDLNLQKVAIIGTGEDVGAAVGLGVRADGSLNLGQNTLGNNIFLGYASGASNTSGYANVFSGVKSGQANTPGSGSVFSGNVFSGNVFSGKGSGYSNTTGSGSGNVFSGDQSGYRNTTGGYNVFGGDSSGYRNTTGTSNVFSGTSSGFSNTTGTANVLSGDQSGYSNTTGTGNVFNGFRSGFNNLTGTNNTALGNAAGPATGILSNTTARGNGAVASASNTSQLGNASITGLRCKVGLTITSDARFKYDVQANVPGLAFITALRPVTYRFDDARLGQFERTGNLPPRSAPNSSAAVHTGFLAQDVERTALALGFRFDGVHAPANARDHYGLGYAQFVVPLVKAIQEQQVQIAALQAQNAALHSKATQADADHAALLSLQVQVARLLGTTTDTGATARARP